MRHRPEDPTVAILSVVETVTPKLQSTLTNDPFIARPAKRTKLVLLATHARILSQHSQTSQPTFATRFTDITWGAKAGFVFADCVVQLR